MNELELRRYIDRNITDVKRTISIVAQAGAVEWMSVKGRPDMTKYLLKSEAANLYLTRGTGDTDGMTRLEISTNYWLKSEDWSKAEHESWSGGEVSLQSALLPYLMITDAAETYLTKNDAASYYLTKSEASTTYITDEFAEGKYLTLVSAQTEYVSYTYISENYYTSSQCDSTFQTQEGMADYATKQWAGAEFVDWGYESSSLVHQENSYVIEIPGSGGTIIGATVSIEGDSVELALLDHSHVVSDITDFPTIPVVEMEAEQIVGSTGHIGWDVDGSTAHVELDIDGNIDVYGITFSAASVTHEHDYDTDITNKPDIPEVTLDSGGTLTVDGDSIEIPDAGTVSTRLGDLETRVSVVEADLGTASSVLQQIINGGY